MIRLFNVAMSPTASDAVTQVLSSGYIGQGPVTEEFEREFHALVGTAVPPLFVNSCTSAITLALDLAGVGPEDEVITTPMTCLATNFTVLHRFARPIWADVNPITGLIEPDSVAERVTPKTKAIIAVDWAGRQCDYARLKRFGVPVIEDAAHCLEIGGPHGDYVCWSFQAIKFLTTVDGGALLVPPEQVEQARLLRWFGLDRSSSQSFRCGQNVQLAGYKFQPNDVGAAIGLSNLQLARQCVRDTKRNAKFLRKLLTGVEGISLPPEDDACSWWLFTLLVHGNQADFVQALANNGVEASQVHSRNDLHKVFEPYADCALPGVDHFASHEVAVPCGWWLTEDDLERVAEAVRSAAAAITIGSAAAAHWAYDR